MVCRRCGAQVPSGMSVCPTCGTRQAALQRSIRCRYCRRKTNARLHVCPHCGRTLRALPFYRAWRFYIGLTLLFALGGIGIASGWQVPTPEQIWPRRAIQGLWNEAQALLPEATTVALVIIPTPTPLPTATPTPTLTPTPTATPTPTLTPTPTITPTPTPIPPSRTYKVQPGDTWIGIALQFGISVQDLVAFNGMTTDTILRVGQELQIPLRPPTPSPTPTPTPSSGPRLPAGQTPAPLRVAAPQTGTPTATLTAP